MITPKFKAEMDEYYDALLGDEKVLGVMIRGTDYVTSGMTGDRIMASADQMAPLIHEWIEKYGFNRIFLATEDGDIFDDMISAFGRNLVSVPQERYRASDFQDGITTISELERLRHPDGEYDAYVEDTVVNYLYSIYMLSRCEAFMYSCHCGGVSLARQFNGDRYEKMFSFADD